MGCLRTLGVVGAATILSIGTAGCGKFYWGKPGSTAEDFTRDSDQCAREASATPGGQVIREVFDKSYRACLTNMGYVREQQISPGPEWHRGITE